MHGPRAALELVDALGLDGYHVLHAVRADLLRRLGRHAEALAAYDAALALTDSAAERAHLRRRRAATALRAGGPTPPGPPRGRYGRPRTRTVTSSPPSDGKATALGPGGCGP